MVLQNGDITQFLIFVKLGVNILPLKINYNNIYQNQIDKYCYIKSCIIL